MTTREYFVYTMASISRVIYVGMTNDLGRRVLEHKAKQTEGFTQKYNVNRLVHFEVTRDVREALAREKQIKGWRRSKKIELIEQTNPGWHDLSADWHDAPPLAGGPVDGR
jgi:putative endonuclease